MDNTDVSTSSESKKLNVAINAICRKMGATFDRELNGFSAPHSLIVHSEIASRLIASVMRLGKSSRLFEQNSYTEKQYLDEIIQHSRDILNCAESYNNKEAKNDEQI